MKRKNRKPLEVPDYDSIDTSSMVDSNKRLTFEDIGLQLPPVPPTQVVSIRLPTELLNELKARGSRDDVPYQALIKIFLSEGLRGKRSKSKRSA